MSKAFFTEEQGQQIINAIKAAELNTSGEIRVHIEDKAKPDVLSRAELVFEKLGMANTEKRNGVLIYLAIKSRQFAIWGDEGINEAVQEGFWDSVRDTMLARFKQGQFVEGLTEGIALAGMELQTYFPHEADDVNELDDEITYKDDLD